MGKSIWLVLAVLTTASNLAFAQGGPPLVSDDPGTPGDGHWEINLATLGARTHKRWDVDAFDADINYGLGDRVQLKLDIPLSAARVDGASWNAGLGLVNAGVKWRFLDEDDVRFSMSTYPQYLSIWASSSRHSGVAASSAEFFLPVEFSTSLHGFEFAAEFGRNFVEREADEWEAGVIAQHACGEKLDCLIEIHETWTPRDKQTLLNFGIHWKWSEHAILLAAAGRDVGPSTDDQQHFVFYFGVQLLR